MSLFYWVRGFSPWHSGVDLRASTGTPIHAVFGGTVKYAGDARVDPAAPQIARGGCGVAVGVDVGGGRTTWYCHQSSVAVATGATIAAGQVVGYVDTTGDATGPHLHFGVWQSGSGFIDPLSVVPLASLIRAVEGSGTYAGDPGAGSTPAPAGSAGQTCFGTPGPCFPTGHTLTDADVHTILDRWIQVFPAYRDPVSGSVAQAATLDVLRRFIGAPMNDATVSAISQALQAATSNGGQDAVLGVTGEAIAAAPAAIVGIAAQAAGAIIGLVAPVLVNLGILVVILWLVFRGLEGLLEPVAAAAAE